MIKFFRRALRWRTLYRLSVFAGIIALVALLSLGAAIRHLGTSGLARSVKGNPVEASGPSALQVPTGLSPVVDLNDPAAPRSSIRPTRTIALTFDDGPDPDWTPQVLDILAKHRVKATFFVLGARALEHPELVERVLAEGHAIGNHSYSHQPLGSLSSWRLRFELSLTDTVLARHGVVPRMLRPPYSGRPVDMSQSEFDAAANSERLVVLTDNVARDWEDRSVSDLVSRAVPEGDEGSIITFHDGGGERSRTITAVDETITTLLARGNQFVTVPDFVGLNATQAYDNPGRLRQVASHALPLLAAIAGLFDTVVRTGALLLLALGVLRAVLILFLARRNRRKELSDDIRIDDVLLPPVSVLVPAYNEEAGVGATIKSLSSSDYPEFEIIVIDDGSTDATVQIATMYADQLSNVRVLQQRNQGKAVALNTGIAAAQHDVVVLIDGDTVFEPGTLRALATPLLRPEIGAVGGNVRVGNPTGLLGRWQHIEYVVSCGVERRMFDEIGCVPCVPGAVGAYRKQAVTAVGGIPTGTLAEDTDLTMLVQRRGWQVAFAPSARAWTEVPLSYKSLWRQRYRWTYGTMQAIWKNRNAIRESGPAGRLGRLAFPYIGAFTLLFAFLGPAVDLYAIIALFTGQFRTTVLLWAAINVVAMIVAGYAFALEGAKKRDLWALPLQQFVHRQMMYGVVLASFRSALFGDRLRWHKLERTGLNQSQLATAQQELTNAK